MSTAWRLLKPNHYLSTQILLIGEWQNQDAVAFSQLVDFTRIVEARRRRAGEGRLNPTYTTYVLDAIAKTLRDHPKMNRIVYRGLTGHRWVQFENVDFAVAVEATAGDVNIAYATMVRNADKQGVDALTEILRRISTAPADDPQLNRIRRFPPAITGAVAVRFFEDIVKRLQAVVANAIEKPPRVIPAPVAQ